jgi:diguanylate cyclase (GGDEF)-like protein/PAS domain S-box-containing protein
MLPTSSELARTAATRVGELELFSFAGSNGELREVSEAFACLLGLTRAELSGRSLTEIVHADDLDAVWERLAESPRGTGEALQECRFLQGDGRGVNLQWLARRLPGTNLWRAAGTETNDLDQLLAERVDVRARLDLAVGQVTAAVWDLDIGLGLFSWEPAAAQVLGVSTQSIPHTSVDLAAVIHPDDSEALINALRHLVEEGTIEIGVRVGRDAGLRHLSLRGTVSDHDAGGKPIRALGLVLDVSTEKAMEEQLLRMVASDALTGAPNRRAFDRALRGEWRRCTRAGVPLSIVIIDMDDFRAFNDRFGHAVGDATLCAVARVLTATLNREGDLLARFGGEEFAVVLPGADRLGALIVAQRLLQAARAITIRQADGCGVSISAGTASWHPGTETIKPAQLLDRADQALFAAKADGKNRAIAYEDSLAARDTYQTAITDGLAAGEFELYYQPLIAIETREVVGLEALMRWNRPGHGLVVPDKFIPIAEASTLICELGRWALHEAAGQLATWSRAALTPGDELRVAVNISARHAASPAIIADVRAALTAAGIAPSRLELELTETALTDGVLTGPQLAGLRALGVAVAIDDFGTGYTSIGQLAHLPADTLKIDRNFTASADPRQRGLVTLMIEAAHAFDLQVVAEGVEDDETLRALGALGCDHAQGYLIAKPMPAGQVASWLAGWRAQTLAEPPAPMRRGAGHDVAAQKAA